MSLGFVLLGFPLPIINLLATVAFYWVNRRATSLYVRWHCTQALVSQLPLFAVNSTLFWWTVSLVLGRTPLTSFYVAYLLTAVIFNLIELAATIVTAINVRKGVRAYWFAFGPLTDLICKR